MPVRPLIKINVAKDNAASSPKLIPAYEKVMSLFKKPDASKDPSKMMTVATTLLRLGVCLSMMNCNTILIHVN